MKITREIKTAILVISSILLFIWGYSFLKGKDLLTDYRVFYVEYNNVEGLSPSAPVTINGMVVGKVTDIKLQHTTGKLIVQLQIKNDFPISKSSIATIYEPGLIGGKQIQIIPNFEDHTSAESGIFLKGDVKSSLTDLVAQKLTPLQQKVENVTISLDSVLTNLNKVLDVKSRQNIKSSIENLNSTLSEFSIASKSVNTILDDNKQKIGGIVNNMDKVTSDFSKISDSLSKAPIGKAIKDLEKTLSKVNLLMSDVQAGKGTFGKLIKDDALYNNLNQSSKELELLLQDLRLNPTRYVNVSLFGKKNKPYAAPADEEVVKEKK